MRSILTIALLVSFSSFGQTTTLEGVFGGKNVYIQNPLLEDGYCVNRIEVNGKKIELTTDASAFEINLKSMELEMGTPLKIEIFHSGDCQPRVLDGGGCVLNQ